MSVTPTARRELLHPLPSCFFLLGGTALCLQNILQMESVSLALIPLSFLALGACALWRARGTRSGLSWVPAALAAALAAIFCGPASCLRGAGGLLNQGIALWNAAREDGVALLQVSAGERELWAFALVLMLVLAGFLWQAALRSRTVLVWCHSWLWIFLTLLLDCFSPLGCALLLAGAVGTWLYQLVPITTRRHVIWFAMVAAVLGIAQFALGSADVPAVGGLRDGLTGMVHALRYGQDSLPEGDLRKAAEMQDGSSLVMTVTTQQAKALYLRSYVGSCYRDGVWQPLPGAAYGGDNAGLMDWLAQQDFYPADQYSRYLAASDREDTEDNVDILILTADRSRLYLPYSVDSGSRLTATFQREGTAASDGVFGRHHYSYTERSGSLPGELLQQEAWVSAPETAEQEAYLASEAVYRQFVYQQYLEVDEDLAPMIQRLFWDSQETPGSVYAATARIRDVLETQGRYAAVPDPAPEDQDPIRYFLIRGSGNSAAYAATAVLAYRACGIPARYAEGYLLSQSQARENTAVTLTEQNAHAWVEVYLDAIGWVPVDVTPGYYLDTFALQQLVESLESARSTILLDDSQEKTDEMPSDPPAQPPEDPGEEVPIDLAPLFLGLLDLVALAVVLMFCRMLLSAVLRHWIVRSYRKLDDQGKGMWLCLFIERAMRTLGIQAVPGWETGDTDAALRQRFPGYRKGEYARATALVEKYLYGAAPLRPHEVRTLCNFVDKLWHSRRLMSLGTRLRFKMIPIRLCLGKESRQLSGEG